MMFEYMRLIRPGENPLSLEFLSKVAGLIFFGFILLAIGYKIKGVLGVAIATIFGVLLLLYNQGILEF